MRLIGLAVIVALSLLAPVDALGPALGRNPVDEVFERSLKDLGYVEGPNLLLERRYVGGRIDLLAPAAQELVRLKVDLIVAWSPPHGDGCHQGCTRTIPVAFLAGGAPVEPGLVKLVPADGQRWWHATFTELRG